MEIRRDPLESLEDYLGEQDLRIQEAFLEGSFGNRWSPAEFSRARNVIDWITNDDFLGITSLYEYPRQYQILRDTHELLCPKCNRVSEVTDCWDRTSYDMQRDVLLEYGVCPQCGKTRLELWEEGYIEEIQEVALILGMRSGKTVMMGNFNSTYIAHRYLTTDNPVAYFGLAPGAVLEAGFFAASAEQAKDTIWAGFYNTLTTCPWYHSYIDRTREFASRLKLRWQDTYRAPTTYIKLVPQSLQFISYHSRAQTTAGRTRFLCIVDEMGKFERDDSDQIHSIPMASLQTLFSAAQQKRSLGFNDVPPVQMIEIGSPGNDPDRDPLDIRFRALTETPVARVYSMRLPTWLANKKIKREDLEIRFQTDLIGAQRDFGAQALSNTIRYFPPHMVDSAFFPYEKPGVIWHPFVRFAPLKEQAIYYAQATMDQVNLGAQDGPVFIIGDAGRLRDRFALAIARTIGTGSAQIIRIEGVIQITPGEVSTPHGKVNTEVYYNCVIPIVKTLHEICKVSLVLFDRWDSTMLIQEIREMGIPSLQEDTRVDDYNMARGEFMASRVQIPCSVPPNIAPAYTALRAEIEELRKDSDGRVDHPIRGHNDVIQVVCKAISVGVDFPATLRRLRKATGLRGTAQNVLPPRVYRGPQGSFGRSTMSATSFSMGIHPGIPSPRSPGGKGSRRS